MTAELPALFAFLEKTLGVTEAQLVAALKANFPGLTQAITNLPTVTSGWNNVQNIDGATRFDGTPVKTVPDVRTYFSSDVIPVLETQRGNYVHLVSISKIDFIGPLVLTVGIIVIIYGLLMLFLAWRLEPGRARAPRPHPPRARQRNGRVRSRLDAFSTRALRSDRVSSIRLAVIASSTEWQVGIALGSVVIAVAAVIVIVIVLLACRIARQAKTAEQAVEVVRQQTAELGGIAQINDSGVRILHAARSLRKVAVGQMTVLAAVSATRYWAIALGIAFGAAVVVAILLTVLVKTVGSIEKSVDGLLEIAGKVAANTANIPQLEATAPVLALIVDEAVVQDGYMNALTDGFGGA